MKTFALSLIALVTLPMLAFSAEPPRLFTDASGRSLRASFISAQNGQVTLRLENGQQHTMNIFSLSAADQEWVKAKASAAPSASTTYGGMEFSPNWLPQTLTARRELLETFDFYCKAAVGNAPKGQEPIPGTIVGAIRWLMPIDEAIQTLPKGYNKLSERTMVHSCLPNNSLILCGFQFKSFIDREQPFNQMFMLIDKQRRVVSVQFVDQNGKNIQWFRKPDGIREPYYNMLSLTFNGSSSKEVPYQILGAGSGVTCIKTAFRDKVTPMPNLPNMPQMAIPAGRTMENVHWYIPAPFARSILDIVDIYRKAGVIK
jgi:hypothetical protein